MVVKQSQKSKVKSQKSFTLIEMLVAVAIFSLIVGATTVLLISTLRVQRKSLATQELLSQTSYVMEYMSRALRMAKKDTAGACIATNLNYKKTRGGRGIKFKNYQDICQEFYLAGTRLREIRGLEENYLTAGRLRVLAFNIGPDDSWGQDDNYQPRVTLFLRVQGGEKTEIKIQTTISQRNPDIKR